MGKNERQRLERIYKESKLKTPYTSQSLVRRFWTFQNERIPLLIMAVIALALTSAICRANNHFHWSRVVIASVMVVLYFLQIRLADEPKDYEHDNKYYPSRPVQRGVITLKELSTIKNFVIVFFFVLAALTSSWLILSLAFIQQFYSYLTRQEFFIREWLRRHFLTYQFIHYVQLFILTWLVLTILGIQPLGEKLIYFVFAMLMIGMIESSRTIGGSDNKKAKDRYSYRIGIPLALTSFICFTLAVTGYTIFLIYHIQGNFWWIFLTLGILAIGASVIKYEHEPTTKNAEIMNGTSLIMYLCAALTLIVSK